MIAVTRLDGTRVVVNAELIETIEAVPETVIVLVTRRRIMVREPVNEVVERVLAYRRGLVMPVDAVRGALPARDTPE
ncbi:flagellar FlbD family protein [Thermomicrobium sp. CFH 73360]|uniref:flagellar FlbD family protein n=1 Tax=Thermomicrobium sp. CFH 73360 TaxID=2951987 RepID=UPI00207750B7|nr:flagellar FlbD family protein [Thermomicrobium sp. CFH 73360]MCM8746338.1 flagellar FlbD family protein [Thermomicrobium sp. CFH 73360]